VKTFVDKDSQGFLCFTHNLIHITAASGRSGRKAASPPPRGSLPSL
jgi:hypothetical protein